MSHSDWYTPFDRVDCWTTRAPSRRTQAPITVFLVFHLTVASNSGYQGCGEGDRRVCTVRGWLGVRVPIQGCGEGDGRGCTVRVSQVRTVAKATEEGVLYGSARSGLWRRRRKRVCALQVFEIQEQGEVSRRWPASGIQPHLAEVHTHECAYCAYVTSGTVSSPGCAYCACMTTGTG